MLSAVSQFFADFPTANFGIEEMFTAGDRALVRWRDTWADGHVRGVDVMRVTDGRVAESLLRQGVKPTHLANGPTRWNHTHVPVAGALVGATRGDRVLRSRLVAVSGSATTDLRRDAGASSSGGGPSTSTTTRMPTR